MSSLAEIVEEGKRQLANYQTMILPHGDAARLLAAASAAVEWDAAEEEYVNDMRPGVTMRRLTEAEGALRLAVRGDAAAGGQP